MAKTTSQRDKFDQSTYNKLKTLVMKLERTNYNKIYLVASRDDFYKIFGHSTLIYAHSLAPQIAHLKKGPSIHVDRDVVAVCNDGWIAFHGLETVTANLASIGIKVADDFDGASYAFQLPKTYSKKEITIFRQSSNNKINRIRTAAAVKDPLPKYARTLAQLVDTLSEITRKLNPGDREVIGIPLYAKVYDLNRQYYSVHQKNSGFIAYYKDAIATLKEIKLEFLMLSLHDTSWLDTLIDCSEYADDCLSMLNVHLKKLNLTKTNPQEEPNAGKSETKENRETTPDSGRNTPQQQSLFDLT